MLRLSVLYAAIDGAEYVEVPHLEAASAVWNYAEASALYIFGDALGDPVADRIIANLKNHDLNRTEINGLFNRHETAARIDQALQLLEKTGKAKKEMRQTGGRPEEVWSLI